MPEIRYPQTVPATEAMLCWNADSDQVAIYRWPDPNNHSNGYDFTALAAYMAMATMSHEQRKMMCFIEAMHLIVRDRCDPMAVHMALLAVDEYRDGLAADMPTKRKAMEVEQ